MMDDGKVTEIVLPSGAFARLRRGTYRDWVEVFTVDPKMVGVELAARLVTIDGRKISAQDILGMDMEEGIAVVGLANTMMQRCVATMKGIA